MTNIRTKDMWPEVLPSCCEYPCKEAMDYLFELRKSTYRAFAQIEEEKGFLKREMSLSLPEGQEAVRILVQRGLEEMVEAFESFERDHYLEELIDAINYFWSLAIIDPRSPLDAIIDTMVNGVLDATEFNQLKLIDVKDIGQTVCDMHPVFEKLRHRAWMHNPQSQYFDGWHDIAYFLGKNLSLVISQFPDWSDFVRFYIAKDNVLKFRIRSKY